MEDFYSFMLQLANENRFLFWCALWLWWGFFVALTAVISALSKLFNRILRAINVLARGWPPEHLDADGDFKDDEIKSTINEED